jgi:hypothetical protein
MLRQLALEPRREWLGEETLRLRSVRVRISVGHLKTERGVTMSMGKPRWERMAKKKPAPRCGPQRFPAEPGARKHHLVRKRV